MPALRCNPDPLGQTPAVKQTIRLNWSEAMTHPSSLWPIVAATALALCLSTAAQAQKVKLATSAGDIVVQLDAAKAPKSVENFLQYVKDGHYNGTVFHRVIENFMVQGGGMTEIGRAHV